MFQKITHWFREQCPHCHKKLVDRSEHWMFSIKACPDNHFQIEMHTSLGVQVEYHTQG